MDLRSSDEFRRLRLRGSLNLSLRELKTKTYLKHAAVLLVDHGYHAHRTRAACATLQQTGFSTVRYLAGGIAALRDRDGAFVGERLAAATLNRMLPRDFDELRGEAGWLVVDTANEPMLAAGEAGDLRVIHVPFDEGRRFAARLDRALAREARDDAAVVIADPDGDGYEAIEHELGGEAMRELYFLIGGADAYRAYRASQEAMLARGPPQECVQCGR